MGWFGRRLALACALTLPASGCMSIFGTCFMPSPYVGVRTEVDELRHTGGRRMAFLLLDLPFTTALDTALLPFTVPAGLWYASHPGYGGEHCVDEQQRNEGEAPSPERRACLNEGQERGRIVRRRTE